MKHNNKMKIKIKTINNIYLVQKRHKKIKQEFRINRKIKMYNKKS